MRIAASLVLCFLASLAALAQEDAPPSVFDLAANQALRFAAQREVTALFAQGDYAGAEKRLRELLARRPRNVDAHYNLACALARQEKLDEALTSLEQAVELGFRNRQHIEQDEDLQNLRDQERFAAILKQAEEPLPVEARTIEPAAPQDGVVLISEKNVAWDAALGVFRAFARFQTPDENKPPIAVGQGEAGDLLRRWSEEGTAAGNHGDLYDNHDSDHSNMDYAAFPQLARVEFSEEARQRGLHHGLQRSFLYNAPTIGNSSTALTSGPFWRSQGRFALTQPGGAAFLYVQYRTNQLYFYPEHRDHDPGHNGAGGQGHGDVFPANTPYLILSQGSSGSDRAFLHAVAATLAAFRPEVKQELIKAGLLMPTVQMIFRMSNKAVAEPADYLTGKAHPTVFDGGQLNVAKMVTLAHEIHPESLPPLVQLRVIEEDEGVVGRDYFDMAPRERMFDTPSAIARVVKSSRYERRMVVSAEASHDPRGKPLTFHWVVLRGDAERISIEKRNEAGSVVELVVPYHERRPATPGADLESNRVDIGAFVQNGDYYSAPAFVSFFYLDNEKRVYDEQNRIRTIDYTDPAVAGNYVDPLLDFPKDWRDEYHYADDGALLGWTRIRGDRREEFTSEGLLVLEKDDQGQPAKTTPVHYTVKRSPQGAAMLEQQAAPNP